MAGTGRLTVEDRGNAKCRNAADWESGTAADDRRLGACLLPRLPASTPGLYRGLPRSSGQLGFRQSQPGLCIQPCTHRRRGKGPTGGGGSAVISAKHLWALVLAGGEGKRLRALTTEPCGTPVPKQFCSLWGERSLIEEA